MATLFYCDNVAMATLVHCDNVAMATLFHHGNVISPWKCYFRQAREYRSVGQRKHCRSFSFRSWFVPSSQRCLDLASTWPETTFDQGRFGHWCYAVRYAVAQVWTAAESTCTCRNRTKHYIAIMLNFFHFVVIRYLALNPFMLDQTASSFAVYFSMSFWWICCYNIRWAGAHVLV